MAAVPSLLILVDMDFTPTRDSGATICGAQDYTGSSEWSAVRIGEAARFLEIRRKYS
jgi:hypothetical protein